ncbi:craniofacial development protein 2-like [Octopus bimaculoides]|uniref:craniofacial development protein 2-like n=1 Tax=Octopus bimaculoides TaxID=37653 RepID=UPI00071E058E|nr:craniofacial development protein 2-like [Octopus bimaculoides]|eukprot:XP_014780240.1 PREDICTED: craniofacial development protein 2-like [Octopus bimaculoides]
MFPGIFDDLLRVEDTRKTAIIDRELKRLNMDIAGLQETRLPSNGKLKEQDFTFFWQGRDPEELRQHGVGFAVRNSLLSSMEPPSGGTERILSLRFLSPSGSVHLLSIYAPTLYSSEETNDQFYKDLNCVIRNIPTNENIYFLGDSNARVGSDHDSWPICVGHFGTGNMNDNGQRLLGFCTYHNLCITNTSFTNKPSHKASWRHPRSHHWHQLDLIITRRSFLNSVQLTRSYHSADCDTDHSLIRSRVRILPKKVHHSKKMG